MKIPARGSGLFLATLALAMADPASAPAVAGGPQWQGVMDLGHGKRFLLAMPGKGASGWEKVGDTLGDWRVASYREADRTLVVQRSDGITLNLVLLASPAAATAPAAPNAILQDQGRAFGVNFLQMRADQLKKESDEADRAFAGFENRHNGLDPSQMPAGRVADEGTALKNRAAAVHDAYTAVLAHLAEAQQAPTAAGQK